MAKIYATRDPELSEREIRNRDRARRIAAQGMVLLENNGVLPLSVGSTPLGVFGSGVRRTVKGGTGSGDVNSRTVYNVEQGLTEAGFRLGGTAWLDRYDKACDEHMAAHMQRFMALLAEKGPAALLDALPDEAARINALCELNVRDQVQNVSRSSVLRDAWARRQRVAVHGWCYRLTDGLVTDLHVSLHNQHEAQALQEDDNPRFFGV